MGPNELEDSGEFQGVGKITVRHVIDCVQPHHQGVYTCIGQARDQTMASDPVAISVEGMIFIHSLINKRLWHGFSGLGIRHTLLLLHYLQYTLLQ